MPTTITSSGGSADSDTAGQYLQELKVKKDELVIRAGEKLRLDGVVTTATPLANAARHEIQPIRGTATKITIRSEAKFNPTQVSAIETLRGYLRNAPDAGQINAALDLFVREFGSTAIPLEVTTAIESLIKAAADFNQVQKDVITNNHTAASGTLAAEQAKPGKWFEAIHTRLPDLQKVPVSGRALGKRAWNAYVDVIDWAKRRTESKRQLEIQKAALSTTLLEILKETIPVREELDAKEAVKKYVAGPLAEQEKLVKEASVKAFMEVSGIKTHAGINSAVDIYDGLKELRDMWGIDANIDQLDPAVTADYNIKGVFNSQFKVKPSRKNGAQALVFSDASAKKQVIASDKKVTISGDMKHEELMAVLMNTCDQWKINGLSIKAGNMAEARKFDTALKKLATLPGYDHAANYTILVNRLPFTIYDDNVTRLLRLSSAFHGARADVASGKRRDITKSRRWGNRAGHTAAMAEADTALPAIRDKATERLARRAAAAATAAAISAT